MQDVDAQASASESLTSVLLKAMRAFFRWRQKSVFAITFVSSNAGPRNWLSAVLT